MKCTCLLITLFITTLSFAQNVKIKDLEGQRTQMLREIQNTDKLLRDTEKSTSTLLNRIKLISSQISSRQQVLLLLEQEIKAIGDEQKKTETDIVALEADLKDQRASYAKAINAMLHNQQSENKLLFVLSGKSLAESYRRLRYLKDYSEWRRNQAAEIQGKSQLLNEKKIELQRTRAGKIALLSQRENEQNKLKQEEGQYQEEIKEAQKKQGQLQKTLDEKRQQAAALSKQIEKLIAEEVARQQREARRIAAEKKAQREREAARREAAKNEAVKNEAKPPIQPALPDKTVADAETAVATDTDLKLSTNFAANKGKLPFPMTGNYTITSRFGTHQHERWKVQTSNNGIDIQSGKGAECRSIYDGVVTHVWAFRGFNLCILVRHGNYISFYGNIQDLYVKQGDNVKAGQALGQIFTDPDSNTTEMHFELWQGTTKLNPEPWLKK